MARFKREHVQSSVVTVLTLIILGAYVTDVVQSIPAGWGVPIPFMFAVILFINLWVHAEKAGPIVNEGKSVEVYDVLDKMVIDAFHTLCKKYGLRLKLKAYAENKANAYTFGWGPGATAVVSSELGNKLTPSQAMGVLAHEVGHQVNADLLLTILVRSASVAVAAIQQTVFFLWAWQFLFGGNGDQAALYWSIFIQLVVAELGINFLQAVISREREQMADAFAVANGYGKGLLQALETLGKEEKHGALVNIVLWFFGSHPPVWMRIRDIRLMIEGRQGLVPDQLENFVIGTVTTTAWAYGYWYLGNPPLLYYIAPVFIVGVLWAYAHPWDIDEAVMGKKVNQTAGSIIAGLLLLCVMAAFGAVTLTETSRVLNLGWQQTLLLVGSWGVYLVLYGLHTKKLVPLLILVGTCIYTLVACFALYSLF